MFLFSYSNDSCSTSTFYRGQVKLNYDNLFKYLKFEIESNIIFGKYLILNTVIC